MGLYVVAKVYSRGMKGYRLLDKDEGRTKDVSVESLFNFVSRGGYIENIDSISSDEDKLPLVQNGKFVGKIDDSVVLLERDSRDILSFWCYDIEGLKLLPSKYIANFYRNHVGAEEIHLVDTDSYYITYILNNESRDKALLELNRRYQSGKYIPDEAEAERISKIRGRKSAVGDIRYTISEEGELSLTECNSKIFVIPEGVISILEFNSNFVEHVKFPKSLINIGNLAFKYCRNLKSVDLSQTSVKYICDGAFLGCENLETVILADTVEYIGAIAFKDCRLNKIDIPKYVTTINKGCFDQCIHLKEVNFNDGLREIEGDAFKLCSLKKVVVPDSVEYINKYAFDICNQGSGEAGAEVYIPKDVINVDELLKESRYYRIK